MQLYTNLQKSEVSFFFFQKNKTKQNFILQWCVQSTMLTVNKKDYIFTVFFIELMQPWWVNQIFPETFEQ